MKQLITTVEDLKEQGIGFRSLTEAIDTTNAAGELFFHIFGALAQFERSIIRKRTNAGLAASLARGRKGGRKQRVTSDDIGAAIALLGDPKISVRKAAKRLGICRTEGKTEHGASPFAPAGSLVGPAQSAYRRRQSDPQLYNERR
jgi:DNA invertase Pin-like site-specific DNA recombinase